MTYFMRLPTEASYAKNRYILKWWTPEHDKLLADQIGKEQWIWYWKITEKILEITSEETINNWKNKDPICKKYFWYKLLYKLKRISNRKM